MNEDNVLIQVNNLQKSFGGLDVLRGITTEIKKGEVVAIIGPFRLRKIYVFTVFELA